jgi:hypothetical protein
VLSSRRRVVVFARVANLDYAVQRDVFEKFELSNCESPRLGDFLFAWILSAERFVVLRVMYDGTGAATTKLGVSFHLLRDSSVPEGDSRSLVRITG